MSTMAPSMDHNAVTLSGAIMVAAVVVIFFLFVFFFILYIRSNLLYADAEPSLETNSRPSVLRRALHPAVLKSLPVARFSSVQFKDGVECAVCISELTDGELFRLLPGCRHGFHLECIDLWFGSNSTCPVCRSSVELQKKVILSNAEQSCSVKVGSLQADCSGEGCSRRTDAGVESCSSSLQSSGIRAVEEEVKSLRRMVAEGSRGVSSRGWDVEQGLPAVDRVEGEGEGEESSSS